VRGPGASQRHPNWESVLRGALAPSPRPSPPKTGARGRRESLRWPPPTTFLRGQSYSGVVTLTEAARETEGENIQVGARSTGHESLRDRTKQSDWASCAAGRQPPFHARDRRQTRESEPRASLVRRNRTIGRKEADNGTAKTSRLWKTSVLCATAVSAVRGFTRLRALASFFCPTATRAIARCSLIPGGGASRFWVESAEEDDPGPSDRRPSWSSAPTGREIVAPGVSRGRGGDAGSQPRSGDRSSSRNGLLSPLQGWRRDMRWFPRLTPGATICRRSAAESRNAEMPCSA
jgi:hypothetical protein